MALTRAFLKSLGITEAEVIDSIIGEHVNVKNEIQARLSDAEKKSDELQAKYDKEVKELEALKTAENPLQSKLEKAEKDLADYKAEVESKETSNQKITAYKELLKASGIDEKRFNAIIKVTDLSGFDVKDGKFDKADDITKNINETWGDFKVSTQTQGANVETPPDVSVTSFTPEAIKGMSADEINKNWGAIKTSLKK